MDQLSNYRDVETLECVKCHLRVDVLKRFAPKGEYVCSDCMPNEAEPSTNTEQHDAEQKLLAKLRASGYRKRNLTQTLCNFKPPTDKARILIDAIKEYDPKSGKWLFILGKTGAGKDHIACAIGRRYIEANPHGTVMAGTMQAIMRTFRDTAYGENRNECGAFDDIARVGLLIIRDAGVKKLTDAERGVIVDIIDARYDERLPIIVTGNIVPEELSDVFDIRVTDRLEEMAFKINNKTIAPFDWSSYRARRAE